ncbi:MAG: amino acid ABC transporter permease [Bacillota bacterium]
MDYFIRCLKFILPAAEVTILVTVASLALGVLFGLLLAVARIYGRPGVRLAAALYSRVVRSLPSLVMIFIVFFTMVSVVPGASPLVMAVVALGACTTAYQSEIFRGAIQSLGSGQMLAARSLGMSRAAAIRFVIIPQALRLAIPAWSNEAAIVLKDSSLASAVGTVELLRRSQHIAAANHHYLPAYLACALIYFCLTFLTNRVLDAAEKRFRLRT